MRTDGSDTQFLQKTPELGETPFSGKLLFQCHRFMLWGFEDGVSIMVDRHRDAVVRDYPLHELKIAFGILLLPEAGVEHLTCSIINGANEAHPGASTFKPVMTTPIYLH
jgi:hypothetical protein